MDFRGKYYTKKLNFILILMKFFSVFKEALYRFNLMIKNRIVWSRRSKYVRSK